MMSIFVRARRACEFFRTRDVYAPNRIILHINANAEVNLLSKSYFRMGRRGSRTAISHL